MGNFFLKNRMGSYSCTLLKIFLQIHYPLDRRSAP
jgi:hypothetical protein